MEAKNIYTEKVYKDIGAFRNSNQVKGQPTYAYDKETQDNLMQMMNMGFMDFDKNLELLQKNNNNLEVVCTHMLSESNVQN